MSGEEKNIDFGLELLAVIASLRAAGLQPQTAVRLGAFAMLEDALGRDVWKVVGFPDRLARRWRADIREAAASGLIPDVPPAEFLAAAYELSEQARAKGDNDEV